MKKILILTLLSVVGLISSGWGADYYVDKRNTYNGDGTLSTPAASNGAPGAFNECDDIFNPTVVNDGDTVTFVAGSGPYLPSDMTYSPAPGYFYPAQVGSTTVFDLNGNVIKFDISLVTSAYQWQLSTDTGKETWWYVTLVGGGDPSLSDPKSVIVNGDWNDEATCLTPTSATSYKANNYGYGDFDSLGFSTVYVKTETGATPTEVEAATDRYPIRIKASVGPFEIKDGTVRGSTDELASVFSNTTFRNMLFYNGAWEGVDIRAGSEHNIINCRFINAGHRAVYADAGTPLINVYHNYFEGVHLAVRMNNTAHTVVYRNNLTYNLYAGGIQKDNTTSTLTEDHNQWHIDPSSLHGSKAIAFTTSTTQWGPNTAATDIPASTSVTNSVGVDPLVRSAGKVLSSSDVVDAGEWISGINDGGELDPWGRAVYGLPNIGVDQGAGAPSGSSKALGMPGCKIGLQ